mmetsp:Transcript_41624/g.107694  ORF Transcript_41624/g.107694 Transcript_41624/m.107694 type:complete len:410 (+) Transcript_41624:576-1805(+)
MGWVVEAHLGAARAAATAAALLASEGGSIGRGEALHHRLPEAALAHGEHRRGPVGIPAEDGHRHHHRDGAVPLPAAEDGGHGDALAPLLLAAVDRGVGHLTHLAEVVLQVLPRHVRAQPEHVDLVHVPARPIQLHPDLVAQQHALVELPNGKRSVFRIVIAHLTLLAAAGAGAGDIRVLHLARLLAVLFELLPRDATGQVRQEDLRAVLRCLVEADLENLVLVLGPVQESDGCLALLSGLESNLPYAASGAARTSITSSTAHQHVREAHASARLEVGLEIGPHYAGGQPHHQELRAILRRPIRADIERAAIQLCAIQRIHRLLRLLGALEAHLAGGGGAGARRRPGDLKPLRGRQRRLLETARPLHASQGITPAAGRRGGPRVQHRGVGLARPCSRTPAARPRTGTPGP